MAPEARGPFASTAAVVAKYPARLRQKTETPCSSYWPRLPASPRDDVETGKPISHRPALFQTRQWKSCRTSWEAFPFFPSTDTSIAWFVGLAASCFSASSVTSIPRASCSKTLKVMALSSQQRRAIRSDARIRAPVRPAVPRQTLLLPAHPAPARQAPPLPAVRAPADRSRRRSFVEVCLVP